MTKSSVINHVVCPHCEQSVPLFQELLEQSRPKPHWWTRYQLDRALAQLFFMAMVLLGLSEETRGKILSGILGSGFVAELTVYFAGVLATVVFLAPTQKWLLRIVRALVGGMHASLMVAVGTVVALVLKEAWHATLCAGACLDTSSALILAKFAIVAAAATWLYAWSIDKLDFAISTDKLSQIVARYAPFRKRLPFCIFFWLNTAMRLGTLYMQGDL